jgi:hypothetical protein
LGGLPIPPLLHLLHHLGPILLGFITKLKYPPKENYVKYLKKEVRGMWWERRGWWCPRHPWPPAWARGWWPGGYPAAYPGREEELRALEEMKKDLEMELREISRRIEELQKGGK